jgi:RNA polymerase sigma-70 factor (ECF subfamily)
MYEEKSTREIASQVGLSENATLQLIFRARAAFKKALLGADVDTAGMSVSAILSVAARKAAHEAKQLGAQAMVFVLFMLLAVGAFVNIGNRNQDAVIAEADRNPVASNATPSISASASDSVAQASTTRVSPVSGAASLPSTAPSQSANSEPNPSNSPFSADQVSMIFSTNPNSAGAIRTASFSNANTSVDKYDVYDNLGNHAVVSIATTAGVSRLEGACFDFTINGFKYFAYLQDTTTGLTEVGETKVLNLSGVVKLPFDEHNVVWDRSPLAGTRVSLQLSFGATSPKVTDAILSVSAPTK